MKEVEDCLAWSGQRPVDWLLDHAPVDERWCLIHATHMTDDESGGWRAAARSPASARSPRPISATASSTRRRSSRRAARFGIGTDSNVLIDAAAASCASSNIRSACTHRARNVLATAAQPADGPGAVRCGGGRRRSRTGRPGAVCARAHRPISCRSTRRTQPLSAASGDALLDAWIFAAGSPTIRSVWRAGKMVVQDGRHVARDAVAGAICPHHAPAARLNAPSAGNAGHPAPAASTTTSSARSCRAPGRPATASRSSTS